MIRHYKFIAFLILVMALTILWKALHLSVSDITFSPSGQPRRNESPAQSNAFEQAAERIEARANGGFVSKNGFYPARLAYACSGDNLTFVVTLTAAHPNYDVRAAASGSGVPPDHYGILMGVTPVEVTPAPIYEGRLPLSLFRSGARLWVSTALVEHGREIPSQSWFFPLPRPLCR